VRAEAPTVSAQDVRRIRELEEMCMLLERALLIQEKRIWSQAQLKLLDDGLYKANAPAAEKAKTREHLLSNLRVSKEVLDRLALDLGYESPTVRKLLGDNEEELPGALEGVLDRIDAREREAGLSHLRSMFRELNRRHDEFLGSVQEQVREDVLLQEQMSAL
jgi:hypothetical protein